MDWDRIEVQEMAGREVLEGGDDDALKELAEDLAATIRKLVADEQVWERLAVGSTEGVGRREINQLLRIDWQALLPEAEWVAEVEADLIDGVTRIGRGEDGSWDEVRESLGVLAERLARDAGVVEPENDEGWWSRFRDRVGYGVSALGQVRKGAVVADALTAVGPLTAGAGAVALIFGAPIVAPALVAAAVAGMGAAAASGLRRGFKEEAEGRAGCRLDDVLNDRALIPSAIGFAEFDLKVIGEMGRAGVLPTADDLDDESEDGMVVVLRRLRIWASRARSRLVAAWPFVAAQTGEQGLRALETVTLRLDAFRDPLFAIFKALRESRGEAVEAAVQAARAALDRVATALDDFNRTVHDLGGAPHD